MKQWGSKRKGAGTSARPVSDLIGWQNFHSHTKIYNSGKHRMLDTHAAPCACVHVCMRMQAHVYALCLSVNYTFFLLLHRWTFLSLSGSDCCCLNSTLASWAERLTPSAWVESLWVFQRVHQHSPPLNFQHQSKHCVSVCECVSCKADLYLECSKANM